MVVEHALHGGDDGRRPKAERVAAADEILGGDDRTARADRERMAAGTLRECLGHAGGEADDPERQIINRWFQKLTPVKSVPIKPVATFTRAAGLWKNDDTIGMKPRQAGAIAATALANGVLLGPGCLLPRRFEIEGVEYVIENGVGRDMVSNGMIEVHDATVTQETLKLTRAGYAFVVKTFGASTLIDAGVLAP